MDDGENEKPLRRIAEALERLSPPPANMPDLASAPAWRWDGARIEPVASFRPLPLDLLTAIDEQKARIVENSERLAAGHAAHDVLLWGARGMGKSALVKSAAAAFARDGGALRLIEAGADRLATLPALFARLAAADGRRFILFIDDIGFEEESSAPRLIRSMLEGGAAARPRNVRLYVTSNRRHIVSRHMAEQDDPVNPRDIVDDRLALSDRFGIRLGFHAANQEDYLAMARAYAEHFGLPFSREDALSWANKRGGRSGRIAWHYAVELAGREGRDLD